MSFKIIKRKESVKRIEAVMLDFLNKCFDNEPIIMPKKFNWFKGAIVKDLKMASQRNINQFGTPYFTLFGYPCKVVVGSFNLHLEVAT